MIRDMRVRPVRPRPPWPITVEDMQRADLAEGYATRDDWRVILNEWMDECTPADAARYRRLHTILQRCIYDGTPLEPGPDSVRID